MVGIESNTTYSKIEKEIGKPNGGVGSGFVRLYYEVGSQYVVMSFSLNDKGEYDKLSYGTLNHLEQAVHGKGGKCVVVEKDQKDDNSYDFSFNSVLYVCLDVDQ